MHQSSSLDFKLVQRICLLQQALDQALDSLEEMRSQIQDQQWIETQLANTEKYANIQQRGIAQLKQNLAQFTDVQNHLLGVMAYRLNALMDQQQREFGRLRMQIHQGEIEVQTYLQYLGSHCNTGNISRAVSQEDYLTLKTEVMMARAMAVSLSRHLGQTHQQLGNLTSNLDNHHLNLEHMVKAIQGMVNDLNALESEGEESSVILKNELSAEAADSGSEANILQDTLHEQAQYIQELEAMLMDQFSQQAQLRHSYQALAAQRDHYKHQLQASGLASIQPAALPEPDAAPGSQSPLRPSVPQPPPPIQPLRLLQDRHPLDPIGES